MKKKFFTYLLITGTILTLVSCASRKYGCPSTARAVEVKVENKV